MEGSPCLPGGNGMQLEKLVKKTNRANELVSGLFIYTGVGFLFVLMLLIMAHVVGRYIFAAPIPGSVELVEFLMIIIVFSGFADCAIKRGNVSVDLFVDRMPHKTRRFIDTCTTVLSIFIVSLITWQSVVQVKVLWQSGGASGVLHIPHYPFAIVMVLGWLAFDLVLLGQFFEYLGRSLKK